MLGVPRVFIFVAVPKVLSDSFGSNTHGQEVGMFDYCLEVAEELGLHRLSCFCLAKSESGEPRYSSPLGQQDGLKRLHR